MARTRRLSELAGRVLGAVEMPAGPVAVALSGGADSAVCAWAALGSGAGPVTAVHVDHGLPGSPVMASAATQVAAALGVPLTVATIAPGPGVATEAGARRARYEALERSVPDPVPILVGHTADDQAETVLLALLRGAGLDGLSGMPAVRGRIRRPLLRVDRSTVREVAVLAGLPYRDDPANDDLRFLRNRVRTHLLPALEAEYAAGLGARLAATAAVLDRDRRLLDRLAAVPVQAIPGGARVPAGAVTALGSDALVARAIRRLLREARPPYGPEEREVAACAEVLAGRTGPVDLAGGVRVAREGPWLVARRRGEEAPDRIRSRAPGALRWGRWLIECSVVGARPPVPLSTLGLVLPLTGEGEVEVRAARAEDRIALPAGSKRVFDALAEAGVPEPDRRRHPVVLVDGALVWVPGVRRTGSPAVVAGRYLCAVAVEESQWDRSGP